MEKKSKFYCNFCQIGGKTGIDLQQISIMKLVILLLD